MQSPRFQAILRVTSGRKKKAPEIKSFSHELNSKGVRPFPVWKSRAFGHMEVCLPSLELINAFEIKRVILQYMLGKSSHGKYWVKNNLYSVLIM